MKMSEISSNQILDYVIIRSLKGDEKSLKFTTDDEISTIILITVISIKIFYIPKK